MTDLDLCYETAEALARRIKAGDLSARQVMENALARIETVNPQLNCFCFVFAERAVAEAAAADEAQARGETLGPLHGVPVAFKDLTPTKGDRTTLGSKVFEHNVADYDPVIVQRTRAAGAIIVGKTNTPEFAHAGFTHSPLWGTTRNPWNPARTPGGSSGGAGAAVASGCVPIAEGTDMGGSVRGPGANCGIIGLKPSIGRIPMDILPSVFDNISHFGPLTRTAADAALFVEVVQGPDDADIESLPPLGSLLEGLEKGVAGKRFALSMDQGFYVVAEDVQTQIRKAVDALEAAGATVDAVELPWTRALTDAWEEYWGVFMAGYFGEYLEEWRDRMDPAVVDLIELGNRLSAVELKRHEVLRSRQWRDLARLFASYDALLTPTMARTAPPVEMRDNDFTIAITGWAEDEEGRVEGLDMTMTFNFVPQCPAISVPAGLTPEGLPVGLQVVAQRYDDAFALRVARAVEQANLMEGRRPAL